MARTRARRRRARAAMHEISLPETKAASRHGRLDRERELKLAFAYRAALAVNQPGTGQSVLPNADIIAQGLSARDELIESHLPLVRWFARNLWITNRDYVCFDDLLGAGAEGLMAAVDRFEPERGYRFGTYAAWWLRSKMAQVLRHERWTMHIPDSTYRKCLALSRAIYTLAKDNDEFPSLETLSKEAGLSLRTVRRILIWIGRDSISLDIPVGKDGDARLGDFLADPTTLTDSCDKTSDDELKRAINKSLQSLKPREQEILRLRFGLETHENSSGNCEHTLEELGVKYGVTRERIRQIEAKALRKLRHPTRSRRLRLFIDPDAALRDIRMPRDDV